MLNAILLTTACLLPDAEPATALQDDQASLVERVKQAVGRGSLASVTTGLLASGKADEYGVDGAVQLLFRLDGSFRLELTGELPRVAASNAHTSWIRDNTGLAREIWLSELDRTVLPMWVLNGTWLWNTGLELEEVSGADGGPALRVTRPDRRLAITVDIDAKSALPTRVSYTNSAGATHWTLEDWTDGSKGFAFPRTWSQFEGETRRHTYRFTGIAMAPHYVVDPFAFRPTQPQDVTWNDEAEVELEVERTRTGHVLVHPLVDGRDLGWFMLDTGAGAMCIDTAVAEELGLPKVGRITAVGVVGKTETSFRRATSVTLGRMTIASPLLLELDLEMLNAPLGKRIAGIIGYDLFARGLLEIEVARPRIALMRPEDYGELDEGWLPLILDGNLPCVEARFEGEHEGFFKIDTGASGTVSFHSPAVVELGLLEGRQVVDTRSGGVGGSRTAKTGLMDWFELAGHRFENPRVNFSVEGIGGFSNRHTLGNIGQVFLEPFTLVLDYPGRRIAFLGGGE